MEPGVLPSHHNLVDHLGLRLANEVDAGRKVLDVIRAGPEVEYLAAIDREEG